MCTGAGKCCVPKSERTRERAREPERERERWGWDMGVHMSLWGSWTVWWKDTVYDLGFSERVTPIMWILRGISTHYNIAQVMLNFLNS